MWQDESITMCCVHTCNESSQQNLEEEAGYGQADCMRAPRKVSPLVARPCRYKGAQHGVIGSDRYLVEAVPGPPPGSALTTMCTSEHFKRRTCKLQGDLDPSHQQTPTESSRTSIPYAGRYPHGRRLAASCRLQAVSAMSHYLKTAPRPQ